MISAKRKSSCLAKSGSPSISQLTATSFDDQYLHSQSTLYSDCPGSSAESSGSIFEIKGILAENKEKYLIDWANNPKTGEAYAPSWEPKVNASASAVAKWRSKKSLPNKRLRTLSLESASSYRFKGQGSSSEYCRTQSQDLGTQSGFWQSTTQEDATSELDSNWRVSGSQDSVTKSQSLQNIDVADVAVRASPQNGQNRDFDLAYKASLSNLNGRQTPLTISSQVSQSPDQSISFGRVIPDSQPHSESSSSIYTSHFRDEHHPTLYTQDHHSRLKDANQSSQSISCVLDTATQSSSITYRRSTSAPASNQEIDSTLPSCLPRSNSDLVQAHLLPQDCHQNRYIKVPNLLGNKSEGSRSISTAPTNTENSKASLGDSVVANIDFVSRTPYKQIEDSQTISQASTRHISRSEITHNPHFFVKSLGQTERVIGLEKDQTSTVRFPGLYRPELPADSIKVKGSMMSASPSGRRRRQNDQYEGVFTEPRSERRRSALAAQSPETSFSAPHSPTNPNFERSRANSSATQIHNLQRAQRPERPTSPQIRSPKAHQSPRQTFLQSSGPPSPLTRQHHPNPPIASDGVVNQASRSPSLVPDRVPYQVHGEPSRLEAQPLNLDTAFRQTQGRPFIPHSIPHTPLTPSKLSLENHAPLPADCTELNVRNLTRGEWAISLSMRENIKDQYLRTIKFHGKKIKTFLGSNPHDPLLINSINVMLDDLSRVTTHMDLQGSGSFDQSNVDPASEADYAEACSEKFAFLGHFLGLTKNQKLNLYIAARSGHLLSILGTYLQAKKIRYGIFQETGSNKAVTRTEAGLAVFIIPSDRNHNSRPLNWPEPDVILAFDETFSRDRVTNLHRSSYIPPIIRPVVFASLEHIDLCIPRKPALGQVERLQKIVWALLQTQKSVGKNPGPSTQSCAEFIVPYVRAHAEKRADRGWPLVDVEPIRGVSISMDPDSTLSEPPSDMDESNLALRFWPNPVPRHKAEATPGPDLLPNGKRRHDIEWGDNLDTQRKKIKMGGDYHTDDDIDNIHPDESQDSLIERLRNASHRIKTLQEQLTKKTVLSSGLHRSASIRQHEYEKLNKTNLDLLLTHKESLSSLQNTQDRLQALTNRYDSLVESNAALKSQNQALQSQLTSHPDPSIASAALDIQRKDYLEAEVIKLTKALESKNTDFEFTRQQYQIASNSAAASVGELNDLRAQNEDLQKKVDHNIAEYKRQADEDITRQLREEIESMKAQSRFFEGQAMKYEADIAELKRGRGGMVTRGSSQQPRSPRGAGGTAGGRSRGVSPAAGLFGGTGMVRGGSGLGERLGARLGENSGLGARFT